ncbi:TerB family tellurite resistance protein [Sphingobium vermicomposti]|uniref:Putative tellurite resistance protein B-like protein n=1 Tax=Sphingobium vermicomposti TaxID=529005 RepID=A0A846M8I5_9SPHN|nr:TerB family tellurite resistance protein [Sphingobium vermicomposti]NIJ17518.1 putative tellurite resistance protein B-like protein [Sphingobium vermicomposti]
MTDAPTLSFDASGVDRVVAEPLRFKQQLRIGEDAFALLRAKKNLYALYETAGAAGTGAAIAGSSAVASTFFAPTGLAAMLGLATAATPVGWVIAAAVVAGGGYYGATTWFSDKTGEFVDTIPKYINTPIDVLGAALIDLLGSLSLRIAAIDGQIDSSELACIAEHFVEDWGFDRTYVTRALDALVPRANETRVKTIAHQLAEFQAANPDCNGPAMQAELMKFLRELAMADGVLDEREELALEAIERQFEQWNRLTWNKAGEGLVDTAKSAGAVAGEAAATIGSAAKSLGGVLSCKLSEASQAIGVKAENFKR